MKIYSEITKSFYDTVEECEKAEKTLEERAKAEEERLTKIKEERKTRAAEVEAALKAAKEAEKTYIDLRNAFVKDYGYYHYTYSTVEELPSIDELFDTFFRIF